MQQNAYTYSYDPMNRIKTSVYKEKESGWTTASNYGNQETGFTYDLNGNILTLQRNDRRASGWMDNLTYDYGSTASNRLLKVTDSGDKAKGFIDSHSASNDFVYDGNGNLVWDQNKGGTETLANGSFDSGNAGWSLTNSGRLTFTSGEVQIATGAAQSILQQTVVTQGKPYVVLIDMERTAGTLEVYVGSTLATFNSTGVHAVTVTSGANNIFSILAPASFAGKIKSISLKGVTVITYNFLNLPEIVTRAGDKQLQYIYDAGGRKLRQDLTNGRVLEKFTDYAGEYIYENDTLQFINHEEGRIVPGPVPGPPSWDYQYHLKDHLGNVRMTFTTKHEADTAVATMETANITEEQSEFLYYNEAVKINSTIFDHTGTGATNYATRLVGGSTNSKYGLAKSLSVMPGDTLNIEVFAKYLDTNSGNWTTALNNFMASIANGTAPAGTFVDGGAAGSIGSETFPYIGTLQRSNDTGTGPKGYLNYILFDRNFVYKTGGFRRLSTAAKEAGTDVAHERLYFDNLVITEPGYVYIYLSNENETNVEVYFDDFKVEHIKSPVIQQDDYYAFGMTFNSYQRENSTANQYLYNGKEKQDELDLGWMDYGARMYDPTIARWIAIDPLSDLSRRWSPYTYCNNDPLIFVDPDGMFTELFNTKGDKIGEDEAGDDGRVSIITNEDEASRISNNSKNNQKASESDVAKGIQTTKTELTEALHVLDRTEGNVEESSVVTPEGEIARGVPGSGKIETINGIEVVTAKLPSVEGENNTSIHSHAPINSLKGKTGNALDAGPNDPATFENYNRNIIVGNLGETTTTTDQLGTTFTDQPDKGAAFYDRYSTFEGSITKRAMQKIIGKKK